MLTLAFKEETENHTGLSLLNYVCSTALHSHQAQPDTVVLLLLTESEEDATPYDETIIKLSSLLQRARRQPLHLNAHIQTPRHHDLHRHLYNGTTTTELIYYNHEQNRLTKLNEDQIDNENFHYNLSLHLHAHLYDLSLPYIQDALYEEQLDNPYVTFLDSSHRHTHDHEECRSELLNLTTKLMKK